MAAKEKTSRLSVWLAPILFLLAAVAAAGPASALTCGALETRAWEKTSAPLDSRLDESLQLLNLHQQNDGAGYDDALGSPLAAENTTVIGKMADLTPDSLGEGESTLDLPDQGNPQANWQQNSGALRSAMNEGNPIRDASVDSSGNLTNNTGFLAAERNLLQDRGWTYDPSTTTWNPPPGAN